MIYADYLATAEAHRWILDTDIAWDDVDPALALEQPDLLDRVRDSALIESYFPLFTPKALSLLWDDVNATAVFSIQLYESYKHFHVFNTYLHCVGYRPVQDDEIVEVRRRNQHVRYADGTELLTRYMMSEHFAAHHFFKDARQAREPVLAHILQLVGRDEVRHAQFASDLLELRLKRDPAEADKVLAAARRFRHIGLEVVAEVPVAEKNDFMAVLTLNQKLQRLTGRGLESFTGEANNESAQPDLEAQLVSPE
jgi:hypothetical protein